MRLAPLTLPCPASDHGSLNFPPELLEPVSLPAYPLLQHSVPATALLTLHSVLGHVVCAQVPLRTRCDVSPIKFYILDVTPELQSECPAAGWIIPRGSTIETSDRSPCPREWDVEEKIQSLGTSRERDCRKRKQLFPAFRTSGPTFLFALGPANYASGRHSVSCSKFQKQCRATTGLGTASLLPFPLHRARKEPLSYKRSQSGFLKQWSPMGHLKTGLQE